MSFLQSESLEVRDPLAIRFLGDTQKRRILREFMEEPKTALQAARSLEMSPTTVYHHVSQLTQVGLLVLVEERRKRGTVEKYLQTPARHMIGAARLGEVDLALEVFRQNMDGCLADIQATLADPAETPPHIAILHLSARVPQGRLTEFMEGFDAYSKQFSGPEGKEMNVMVVVHPQRASKPNR